MSTFRKFNKGVPKFSLKKRLSEPTDSEKEIREEIDKKETKKRETVQGTSVDSSKKRKENRRRSSSNDFSEEDQVDYSPLSEDEDSVSVNLPEPEGKEDFSRNLSFREKRKDKAENQITHTFELDDLIADTLDGKNLSKHQKEKLTRKFKDLHKANLLPTTSLEVTEAKASGISSKKKAADSLSNNVLCTTDDDNEARSSLVSKN